MIRASDLIGCEVQTEKGATVGRVHDLRAERGPDNWRLIGLVVGKAGMLARLTGRDVTSSGGTFVRWQAIVRLEEGVVTIRADTPD